MKNVVLPFFLCLLFFQPVQGQNGWREDEMEVKVFLGSREDAGILKNLNLETEAASWDGSIINAYVLPSELDLLKSTGLNYSISIQNLNEHYRNYWQTQVPQGYMTYDQIVSLADSLATAYPSICKKVIYGTSAGGRQLGALKISRNVNIYENEPAVLFDGGIHGDELLGPELVIRYARDLCTGYGFDSTFTNLINSREIWLYYMVNPDGRVNMSRYNDNGVDCNRDAGYMWNAEGFSPGAFSQSETRALRDCMIENNFVVYTNYHAGTEGIVYPWSFRDLPTPDNVSINQLAYVYSSASGYQNLPYGQGYSILGYYSFGTTKDFLYGSLGNVGWSIEVSNDKQPPAAQIENYYSLNKPAMTEMIIRSGYGLQGIVSDSVSGKPLSARILVNNYFPVYTNPDSGDYHRYLVPGSYSMTVSANGYKSKTVNIVGVPLTGSANVNFQLVRDYNWYAARVADCRIPVTDFTGYNGSAYTPASLGSPDSITYPLWKNGWLILDMGDTIFNGYGNDFRVVESGGTPEGFSCWVGTSEDGPWFFLGSGTGTTSFDLSSASGGPVSKARFLRLADDGDGPSTGTDLGYDLDGIEMLTQPLIVDFSADHPNSCTNLGVNFADQSLGNPVSWSWLFPGGTPSISSVQNPSNIIYSSPGTYDVSLTISNGVSSSAGSKQGYIIVNIPPSVNLGNDTTINVSDSLLLNAGNPGSSYLWSTGDTTQAIFVDSTGIGTGTKIIWALVTDSNQCSSSDTIRISFSNPLFSGTKEKKKIPSLCPNPASGMVFLNTTGNSAEQVRLLTLLGKQVFEKKIQGEKSLISIDLSEIPPGIYIVAISGEGEIRYEQLVVK